MVVVIANDLPPAVRGRMKLWFVEPKPNVFVSGIKDKVADVVVDYLFASCGEDSGLVVFQRINRAPGYKIRMLGIPDKELFPITGFQLIREKVGKEEDNSLCEGFFDNLDKQDIV